MPSYDAFADDFDAWQQAFGGAYDDLILDRLLGLLAQHVPAARRVADLGIGTGDLVIALARRGFDVVGVDVSAPMLAIAQAKVDAASLPSPPRLVRQDLRRLDLAPPVEVAVCVYTVVNQLTTTDDLEQAFASVAGALVPRGVFFFELNLPASYARYWTGSERLPLPNGATVTRTHRPGDDPQVVVADVTIERADGEIRTDTIAQRPWRDDQVAAAAARAGFRVEECVTYDPFRDAPTPTKALWVVRAAG